MYTPSQQRYFDKIKERPAVALLLERLDLVPCETEEFRRNVKIQERVQSIVEQIPLSPVEKRRVIVIKERTSPFENPDLSWVKPGTAPF